SADVQRVIGEIYEDLARHAPFDGLLFQDDAVLDDFEDASPSALQTYREWGLPASVEAIRPDPQRLRRWTERKTRALIDLNGDFAAEFSAERLMASDSFGTIGTVLFGFAFYYPLFMAYNWMIGALYYFFHYEVHQGRVDEPPELERYPGVTFLVPCFNDEMIV